MYSSSKLVILSTIVYTKFTVSLSYNVMHQRQVRQHDLDVHAPLIQHSQQLLDICLSLLLDTAWTKVDLSQSIFHWVIQPEQVYTRFYRLMYHSIPSLIIPLSGQNPQAIFLMGESPTPGPTKTS